MASLRAWKAEAAAGAGAICQRASFVRRAADGRRSPFLRVCLTGLVLLSLVGCGAIRRQRAERQVDRGESLLAQQDLESALIEFERASKLAPQSAKPWSGMGRALRQLGEYERAIDAFVEAIRRNPDSFGDTLNLAQLYHVTERIGQAIQAYLHATELQPESYEAQLNLGVCYQEQGDLAQATDRFQRAVEIEPDRPHAWVNLGVALDGQEKPYEAIKAYKESLERDNQQPEVLVNLARTYMKQDRLKLAESSLRAALRMDEGFAAGQEALGYCLFRMREFEGAQAAYEAAVSLDWRLPRAHAGLGSVLMLRYLEDESQVRFRDRALEHWHRSLEIDADQPRIRKLIEQYAPDRASPEVELLEEGSG